MRHEGAKPDVYQSIVATFVGFGRHARLHLGLARDKESSECSNTVNFRVTVTATDLATALALATVTAIAPYHKVKNSDKITNITLRGEGS